MKSEDNSLEHTKNSNIKLANDLITNDNLSSSKNIEINVNKIQINSYYHISKKLEKGFDIKKELEREKEIKLDNDNNFNQDITQKHLIQNESMKEILIQDEKHSAQKKSESDRDNNDIEELKIRKDILNDFHIKNSLASDTDENKDIIHNNRYLNNNINILNENEDEINYWNFNTSPSKIFNSDNQSKKQNNF